MSTRMDRVEVADGGFDLPIWLPESGRGPGLVLIQEIFGLDDYLTSVAEDLASLGYMVAVPELFWRVAPKWSSGHDEAGLTASMGVVGKFDFELGRSDVIATLSRLRALPEVEGKVGVFGFCLGGSLAFAAAVAADPDTAVSFYGSAVPDTAGLLDQVSCPIQFQFGGKDPYITREQVEKVVVEVAAHPNAEIHVHEQAGHAFHNHAAPMFHDPEAAADAGQRTTEFLGRTLPV